MLILRKRFTLAAGAATLVLLALPSLASARPGVSPELVQRSGRFVVVHADREDGTSTPALRCSSTAHQRLPVRAPEVWIDPGARVRLEGTIQNGALVLSDSETTVTELAAAPGTSAPGQCSGDAQHRDHPDGVRRRADDRLAAGQRRRRAARSPLTTRTSLNAYYQEQTYGQIGLKGTVFGPVSIAGSSASLRRLEPALLLAPGCRAADPELQRAALPAHRARHAARDELRTQRHGGRGRDRHEPHLDQRRVLGSRARARVRAQPGPQARRRPLLHDLGSRGGDQPDLLDGRSTPTSTPSTPWAARRPCAR